MAPTAPPRGDDEPSVSAVLQHMLERDSRHAETMQLVLQRLGDQNGAIQGLQIQVASLVSIGEKQTSYIERQLAIDERTAGYHERIGRAEARIETLTAEAAATKGSTRALVFVLGLGGPVLLGLFTYFNATLMDRIADAKADAAAATAELKERHVADMATAAANGDALRADVREMQQKRAQQ